MSEKLAWEILNILQQAIRFHYEADDQQCYSIRKGSKFKMWITCIHVLLALFCFEFASKNACHAVVCFVSIEPPKNARNCVQ